MHKIDGITNFTADEDGVDAYTRRDTGHPERKRNYTQTPIQGNKADITVPGSERKWRECIGK